MLKPDSRCFYWVLTVLAFPATSILSFDGGGRVEISPYSSKETITVARVSRQKELARTSMTATFELNGSKETLPAVGLEWIKSGRALGPKAYRLNGETDTGPLVVDFSEIEELSILRTESINSKVRALFKVIAFPNVSVEQLVNERPTYTELKEKYSKTLELWVEIKNTSGELCFAGKQTAPRRVGELTNNILVRFELAGLSRDDRGSEIWKGSGEGIWWAIPSVIRDRAYPYRRPVMAA